MHPGTEWVLQHVKDGERWNAVDRNVCLPPTLPTRSPPTGARMALPGGGEAKGTSERGGDGALVRAAKYLPPVRPPVKVG